jgi:hypothetical protein
VPPVRIDPKPDTISKGWIMLVAPYRSCRGGAVGPIYAISVDTVSVDDRVRQFQLKPPMARESSRRAAAVTPEAGLWHASRRRAPPVGGTTMDDLNSSGEVVPGGWKKPRGWPFTIGVSVILRALAGDQAALRICMKRHACCSRCLISLFLIDAPIRFSRVV